jgi:hypothetical protein
MTDPSASVYLVKVLFTMLEHYPVFFVRHSPRVRAFPPRNKVHDSQTDIRKQARPRSAGERRTITSDIHTVMTKASRI